MIPSILPQPSHEPINSNHFKQVLLQIPFKQIFQRVPGLLVIGVVPFSVFGPVYFPIIFSVYFTLLNILMLWQAVRTCYAVIIGYWNSKMFASINWYEKYKETTGVLDGNDLRHDLPFNSIIHVIIIPNYKEDLNTLMETLDILASHEQSLRQYRVLII